MTRDEAQALIGAGPGVCVGTTAWGGPHHFRLLWTVPYLEYFCAAERAWVPYHSLQLPPGTYTRVKDPTLCVRAEDSAWNKEAER